MKAFLIAATALSIAATAPAGAQLLGGGLGGQGGGSLGGTLGGTLGPAGQPGPLSGPVGGAGHGTLGGTLGTDGHTQIDRRSGRVEADRSANGSLGGTLSQTAELPGRTMSTQGSGNASGEAGASGDAQLVGTDAVRGTAGSARATAGNAVTGARSRLQDGTRWAAGVVQDGIATSGRAARASAANAAGATRNQLAIAGSAAAQTAGSVDVMRGMEIRSLKGRAIGKVSDVVADGQGRVNALVVDVDNRRATLPAANFSGAANGLVSAMGEGEIKKASKDQAKSNSPG